MARTRLTIRRSSSGSKAECHNERQSTTIREATVPCNEEQEREEGGEDAKQEMEREEAEEDDCVDMGMAEALPVWKSNSDESDHMSDDSLDLDLFSSTRSGPVPPRRFLLPLTCSDSDVDDDFSLDIPPNLEWEINTPCRSNRFDRDDWTVVIQDQVELEVRPTSVQIDSVKEPPYYRNGKPIRHISEMGHMEFCSTLGGTGSRDHHEERRNLPGLDPRLSDANARRPLSHTLFSSLFLFH